MNAHRLPALGFIHSLSAGIGNFEGVKDNMIFVKLFDPEDHCFAQGFAFASYAEEIAGMFEKAAADIRMMREKFGEESE